MDFRNPYFTTQLITYIGNKRSLLPFLNKTITDIKRMLKKDKLCIFEGFSGSGAVSRLLKYHASQLFVNDMEDYCEILSKCYLVNKSETDLNFISETIQWLNQNKLKFLQKIPGFIEKNYAPKNDNDIKPCERVFYTNRNAKIIDNLKYLIYSKIDKSYRHFFLAPLIVEASIHTNTSGVFKGFHKKNGNGWFGGMGENALTRIKGEINLEMPLFSGVECEVNIFKEDVNELIKSSLINQFDLVYYDPPYNQHPYGSNYFMLNIIANESEEIEIQNGISGIAKNWKRSQYNKRKTAEESLGNLIENTPAKYILLSYNNEGLIPTDKIKLILTKYGKVELQKKEYNTYRGSRNLRDRNIKVQELLWILEKK
ncbi:MAG: DNA adenine methylase [Elusimicrobiota bacterium]